MFIKVTREWRSSLVDLIFFYGITHIGGELRQNYVWLYRIHINCCAHFAQDNQIYSKFVVSISVKHCCLMSEGRHIYFLWLLPDAWWNMQVVAAAATRYQSTQQNVVAGDHILPPCDFSNIVALTHNKLCRSLPLFFLDTNVSGIPHKYKIIK